LKSECVETDLELFNVFHQQAISKFGKKYHPLLDLVVPVYFRWQMAVEKSVVTARSKPLKDNDSASNFSRDLRPAKKHAVIIMR